MKKLHIILLLFVSVYIFACGGSSSPESNEAPTDERTGSIDKEQEESLPQVDEEATARAQIMGAVDLDEPSKYEKILNSPEVKTHYTDFNKQWQSLEESRLSKIRTWKDSELAEYQSGKYNLFYPFSGPDFLNAYEFFPNCKNYLMFGLEKNGKLVDINNMPPNYLSSLRNALSVIFKRNYFITSYMGKNLWGKGVLPIINIFMVRTGNKIVAMKRFFLDKEGKPNFFELEDEATGKGKLEGIMIEFLNKDKKKSQKVYYFGTDVADEKMQSKMELVKFIKSFDNKITFIKSASYILHNTNFAIMRNLVLEDTKAVLQDDTGVRYKTFMDEGWNVQLYGKYARPVADFGGYTYQPALRDAFATRKDIKPLNFTYGYHWKTDNTSVLLATKK